MNWNKRNVLPPLGKNAKDNGNTDGGWSVQLLFQHKSGNISTGLALLHKGSVHNFFPGKFDDCVHVPEDKDSLDPIIGWIVCPTPEEVHTMLLTMESNGECF